jgi:hypothetical protein
MDRKVALIPGKKNLMVVAHPDDETIFGFAQLALTPTKWTVVCVTNGDHPVRRQEFIEVSRVLGVESRIWRFKDERWAAFPEDDTQQIASEIQEICRHENIDNVLTHGVVGEYGHSQHRALHQIVRQAATVGGGGIYTFAKDELPLPHDVLEWKLNSLKIYKTQDILPQHRPFVENEGWVFVPASPSLVEVCAS